MWRYATAILSAWLSGPRDGVGQGGWRLGLLVARNVEPGNGHGGDRRSTEFQRREYAVEIGKVSANEFARGAFAEAHLAEQTTHDRVLRYFVAWERAAAGHVPHAAGLAASPVRLLLVTMQAR